MDARRDWLSFLRERGQRLAEIAKRPLNTPRRLYLTGFVLVVVSFFMGGLIDTFWSVVGMAGLGVICVGFLKEIWEKAKTLLASSIAHKVLGVLIAGAVTLPCYSQAHQAVNRITGLSPESFPFSLSFLAMGYAPPMVLTVGMLILSVYSSWQILVFSWHALRPSVWPIVTLFSRKPTKAEIEIELLHVSRIIAAFTLIAVSSHLINFYDQADETLQQIRSEIVVHADYYPRSPCRNISAQERVAFLKDGKISVATHKAGRWNFRLASCETA